MDGVLLPLDDQRDEPESRAKIASDAAAAAPAPLYLTDRPGDARPV